jgi:hypothetical protein
MRPRPGFTPLLGCTRTSLTRLLLPSGLVLVIQTTMLAVVSMLGSMSWHMLVSQQSCIQIRKTKLRAHSMRLRVYNGHATAVCAGAGCRGAP